MNEDLDFMLRVSVELSNLSEEQELAKYLADKLSKDDDALEEIKGMENGREVWRFLYTYALAQRKTHTGGTISIAAFDLCLYTLEHHYKVLPGISAMIDVSYHDVLQEDMRRLYDPK